MNIGVHCFESKLTANSIAIAEQEDEEEASSEATVRAYDAHRWTAASQCRSGD
jgi:hypothetical protein